MDDSGDETPKSAPGAVSTADFQTAMWTAEKITMLKPCAWRWLCRVRRLMPRTEQILLFALEVHEMTVLFSATS